MKCPGYETKKYDGEVPITPHSLPCPVGWGCRIHRMHFCGGVRPFLPKKCPVYDTNKSDCAVPIMLELWGMRSTSSCPEW